MIPLTLAQLADVVGGTLHDVDPGARVDGSVVTDSRQAGPGSLFVALPGEHADGHDFAAAAVEAGAVAVLGARPCGVPTVAVEDVTIALGRLARAVCDRLTGTTVVGVSGSSGKTSTKDLLASVLGSLGPTIAPAESYNNEIGHPLTVLRADESTRHLVLELSARGVGHIRRLTEIAPPRIGALLNVGTAHLGEFGSREAIALAKGELVEALPADGTAVLNVDDPLVAAMADRSRARVVGCGTTAAADIRADGVTVDERARPSFTLVTPEGSERVDLPLSGRHNVSNALVVAAVARELDMPVRDVADRLAAAAPASRWRMEVSERTDGVTVVNDAYNANPESMRAALQALASMSADRRSMAVLGEMAELGEQSARAHYDIGVAAAEQGVACVVAVGGAAAIARGAREAGAGAPDVVEVPDAAEAVAELSRMLRPGDVVLVKGSRVARLERVASALQAGDAAPGGPRAGEVPA